MKDLERKIVESEIILREKSIDCQNFSELLRFIYELKRRQMKQFVKNISFIISVFSSFITIVLLFNFLPYQIKYSNSLFSDDTFKGILIIVLSIIIFFPIKKYKLKKLDNDKNDTLEKEYFEQLEAQKFIYNRWYNWNSDHNYEHDGLK